MAVPTTLAEALAMLPDNTVGDISELDMREIVTFLLRSMEITDGGGTPLAIGAVADGQFLKRSGTTLVGGTVAADFITIDFTHDFSVDGTNKDAVTIPVAINESILLSAWGCGWETVQLGAANHIRFRSFTRFAGNVFGPVQHIALADDVTGNGILMELLPVGTNVIIRTVSGGGNDVNWNIKYLLQRKQ